MKQDKKFILILGISILAVIIAFTGLVNYPGTVQPSSNRNSINAAFVDDGYGNRMVTGYSAYRAAIPPGEIKPLIEDLSDENPAIRYLAVSILERMGDKATPALPALIKALSDSDKGVRYYAAITIGNIGPLAANAVPALVDRLNSEDDHNVLSECEEALVEIGEPAIPALLEALGSEDSRLRSGVASILVWSPWEDGPYSEEVFSALWEFINDTDSSGRANAVLAIGIRRLKPEIVVPKLLTLLASDEDESVREQAAVELGRYGPEAGSVVGTMLDLFDEEKSPYVRDDILWVIPSMGEAARDAVPRLLEMLDGPHRCGVIGALAKIGPEPGVLPSLLKLMKDEDPDIRDCATHKIRHVGPEPGVVKALIEALHDENIEVQKSAKFSLNVILDNLKEALRENPDDQEIEEKITAISNVMREYYQSKWLGMN